jgi:hypothetical protein
MLVALAVLETDIIDMTARPMARQCIRLAQKDRLLVMAD